MKREKVIYMDVCCLNRPCDDQGQYRVHMESESVMTILAAIQAGRHRLVSSEALLDEVDLNPNDDKRQRVLGFLRLAKEHVEVRVAEAERALVLEEAGLGSYDALHVACAESAGADVLLTTDDGFINKARGIGTIEVEVTDPVTWLKAGGI